MAPECRRVNGGTLVLPLNWPRSANRTQVSFWSRRRGVGRGSSSSDLQEDECQTEGSASVNRPLGGGVTFESTVGGRPEEGGRVPRSRRSSASAVPVSNVFLGRFSLAVFPLFFPLPRSVPSPLPAWRADPGGPRRPPGKRSLWEGAWALSGSKWLSLFVFSLVCFLLGSGQKPAEITREEAQETK